MIQWEKRGLLFTIDQLPLKKFTHAQVPTPLLLGNKVRIFFSSRCPEGKSRIFFVDYLCDNFPKLLNISSREIISLGGEGAFDEHGMMPSSIVKKDGVVYLYYSGWKRTNCKNRPYENFTGLAISNDNGETFERYSKHPVIGPHSSEVFSATSPTVFFDGKIWHCWYSAGIDWIKIDEKFEHVYEIRYASSNDGFNWNRFNTPVIPRMHSLEAQCKVSIIQRLTDYEMYFSYRDSRDFRQGNGGYRIARVLSNNLTEWHSRKDLDLIEHEGAWDEFMQAYPTIFNTQSKAVMLYNGNSFGKDGFGFMATSNPNFRVLC